MQDVALRRRIAALVLAALLAVSGAALATAYFAADEQATGNTGNAQNMVALRGGGDRDQAAPDTGNDLALKGLEGDDY